MCALTKVHPTSMHLPSPVAVISPSICILIIEESSLRPWEVERAEARAKLSQSKKHNLHGQHKWLASMPLHVFATGLCDSLHIFTVFLLVWELFTVIQV